MQTSIENLAKKHYENFPVGSWFISKRHRKPIHLIYAFARVADDIADEGSMSSGERIARIDTWQESLENSINGKSNDPFFQELAATIKKHHLSIDLLKDLLLAFRRDSDNPSYTRYDDVLEYCRYSANPIGRLLLQIFECSNEKTEGLSDNICTALQLTNFWQDISVDTSRNRFYISQQDMIDFGVSREDLQSGENGESFRAMMKLHVGRTKSLFDEGKPLLDLVAKDFRFELAMIWHGGMRILERIEEQNFDTRLSRPALNAIDKVRIFLRAVHQ